MATPPKSSASLAPGTVRELARLAGIFLGPEEGVRAGRDLAAILNSYQGLAGRPKGSDQGEPASCPLRADLPHPDAEGSMEQARILLAGAPDQQEGQFRVPRTIPPRTPEEEE